MKGNEATAIVGDIASQQWGLITATQAQNNGINLPSLRRLEQRGVLTRVRHGVYASMSTSLSPEIETKAQWLALRPELMAAERISDSERAAEAVVSHTSAAEMWRIGNLWSEGSHFTVKNRRRSRQADVSFHTAQLIDSDWTIHPETGLPVTTVTRTIFDLVQAQYEENHLIDLISDASRKSLLHEQDLRNELRNPSIGTLSTRKAREKFQNLVELYFAAKTRNPAAMEWS